MGSGPVCRLERRSGDDVEARPARQSVHAEIAVQGEHASQAALWRLIKRDDQEVAEVSASARTRMRILMEKYRDLPMDLADASLVALAEERRLNRVFTLDRDFRVYGLPRGASFDIIP